MLDILRRGATGKIAALIIFIPLIIAFTLWGISPELRRTGTSSLANVGKTEITPEQFQQAMQIELSQLSAQFGRRVTPEQGRMFGLDQRVLSRLVGAAALDNQARELGLTASEKTIAEEIQSDPNFAGLDGRFSRDRLNQVLLESGLTEQGYLAIRRKDEVRAQIAAAMQEVAKVPKTMVELLHKHRSETRVLEFFTIDAAKVVKVAAPDETKLKEFYEQNKRSFMTPALRKVSLLLLTREQVKQKIEVSDADVKASYEATKESYNTAETRKLQQVAFPDKAAADKAYATLSTAKNFVEEAAKLGFKETDIDLGTITKSALIDKKIAEAAFALKKGEISRPVEGQFTTVILRAVEVTPAVVKTFEDVKALVKDKLANERSTRDIQQLHDKVEDERTAGRTLKEAAEKLGATYLAVDAIDRNGNGPDGKPVAGIPDTAKVLGAAFAGAQGVEADAIELADGGYAWFDVLAVTPEKQRAFDDVKSDVTTRWTDVEKGKALTEAAAKFVERVIKGEAMAAIAKDAGGKLEKTAAITRSTSPQGLTADAVRQAFALPKGAGSSAATADGKSRTVFRIVEVTPGVAPSDDEAKRLAAELQRGMQNDALNAYVSGLQDRYGVNINNQVLQQTLGLDREVR